MSRSLSPSSSEFVVIDNAVRAQLTLVFLSSLFHCRIVPVSWIGHRMVLAGASMTKIILGKYEIKSCFVLSEINKYLYFFFQFSIVYKIIEMAVS